MFSNAPRTDTLEAQLAQSATPFNLSFAPEQPKSASATYVAKHDSTDLIRRSWSKCSEVEKKKLDGYYIRLRYNDQILRVPGCAASGRQLDGDETFCTLEAFKRVADGFIPKDWRSQCARELKDPIAGIDKEPDHRPGYIEEGF